MHHQYPGHAKCRVAVASLVVLLLAGCGAWPGVTGATPTAEPSPIDWSTLTGVQCAPPCWYGLEVDRSTKADVLATAPTVPFIDPKATSEEPESYFDRTIHDTVPATMVRLVCRRSGDGPCAAVVIAAGVVKGIYLFGPPSLTLGEAVDHLGPPEYVGVVNYGQSVVDCYVSLLWKQRGIVVEGAHVRCQDVRGGMGVRSNLHVVQIVYRSLADFATVPKAGMDFPWPGFAKP